MIKDDKNFWAIHSRLDDMSFHTRHHLRDCLRLEEAGGVIEIFKTERGCIVSCDEGVILTTQTSAAEYAAGNLKFADIPASKRFAVPLKDGREMVIWCEPDRFIAPCECRPAASESHSSVWICGEDDCAVHGFGAEAEDD